MYAVVMFLYTVWGSIRGIFVSSLKHGAILYNEAEVFNLSITNRKGRPMFPFDWLIHSVLILARYAFSKSFGERRVSFSVLFY